MTADGEALGPIDFVLVQFPGQLTGGAAPLLVDLVDRGLIRIIDIVFIRKDADGSVFTLALADPDMDGVPEFRVFDGAASGLLGESDVGQAGTVMEPDTTAVLLVYENSWLAPFVSTVRGLGGELKAHGRIPTQTLIATLDAAEAAD